MLHPNFVNKKMVVVKEHNRKRIPRLLSELKVSTAL